MHPQIKKQKPIQEQKYPQITQISADWKRRREQKREIRRLVGRREEKNRNDPQISQISAD